jgi:para-nitrobenzyl esterase
MIMLIRISRSVGLLGCAFALALHAGAAGCGSSDPDPGTELGEKAPLVVTTDKGAVEGGLLGTTRAFLGVPFAAPPLGDLRWKPPAPHAPWTDTLKATEKGRACAQMRTLGEGLDASSGEDCLTLNVWTPERPASSSLPVLVWIHGGAFVLGSGSSDDYDGQLLSEATGAVVVTVNYRLGPLGFLALPELKKEDVAHPGAGNYGIEDQRAALEWVKANIGAFGGDAKRVTLFGESAGGISTCIHLVSPQSDGLFERAIIESGPCDSANTEAEVAAQGAAFIEALGCKDAPDALACLRAKSTEEVMTALPSSNDFLFGDGPSWFPVIDGFTIPDSPGKLLESGSFTKVPTILGSNADEGTLFVALSGSAMIADDAAFETFAEALVPGKGKEVVAKYPSAMYGSAQAAATAAVGDAGFVCPTRRAARAIAKGGADTYLYHFTFAPEGALFPDLGAFHSAEIRYVFGVPSQLIPQPLTDEELSLHAAVSGYWARLADKGDPNGEGAAEWPKYDPATDESIRLDVTITKQPALKKELCDFWDSVTVATP